MGFSLVLVLLWPLSLSGVLVCISFYLAFLDTILTEGQSITYQGGPSTETSTVPAIVQSRKYLGSSNITSSDFSRSGAGVLSLGDGKIVGRAEVNGVAVSGLKLRLALNGSVYSQWATTNSDGQYTINIPYGEYRIDGFELDRATADEYLSNKIESPQLVGHSSSVLTVTPTSAGRGLTFSFVDPIIKTISKKQFENDEKIVLEWEEYPNALTYSVQIYEKVDPYKWSNKRLFEWSNRPELLEPKIDLTEYGVKLTGGKFYLLEISAKDENNRVISESVRRHSGYDFEVLE